jgi:D-alanyl-D-alanine dipeptidase
MNTNIKEIKGLVNVEDIDKNIIIDMKYASDNNFVGRAIYPVNICVLKKETAFKLKNANEEFKSLGFTIKVWDAYRPMYVQRIFWEIVKDERFVANPNKKGSRHSSGIAVDVTLVDEKGKEIIMPSHFDDFSENAYRSNVNINKEARNNLDMLTKVMRKHGFLTIDTEWWHFEDGEYVHHELIDIILDEFLT